MAAGETVTGLVSKAFAENPYCWYPPLLVSSYFIGIATIGKRLFFLTQRRKVFLSSGCKSADFNFALFTFNSNRHLPI
jgi:hypothetical protein